MTLQEAALRCEKAWGQYAEKFQLKRDDVHYLLKMQEELGELVRSFQELRGAEKKRKDDIEALKKRFADDIAVLVGNALIMALHFKVDLEKTLLEKFPVSN